MIPDVIETTAAITTEPASTEHVHEAVVFAPIIPIAELEKINATEAGLAQLKSEAEQLVYKGVRSKEDREAVHKLAMVAVKTRTAAKELAKTLAAPFGEKYDKIMVEGKRIGDEAKVAEDMLIVVRNNFDKEQKRLAEEAEKALRVRFASRTTALHNCLFIYDAQTETYGFGDVLINVDDIRNFSDEEYEPTAQLIQQTYQAEINRRKLIADQQQRTQERISTLLHYGFVYNESERSYDFIRDEFNLHLRIALVNIEQESAAEFAPLMERATSLYRTEQQLLTQQKERQQAEAKRIADEQEAERVRLEAQKAELKRQQDELAAQKLTIHKAQQQVLMATRWPQLVALGLIEYEDSFSLDDIVVFKAEILDQNDQAFTDLIASIEHEKQLREQNRLQQEADAAQRIKDQQQAERDQKQADKERVDRLKPEKKDFSQYLRTYHQPIDLGFQQPEMIELVAKFNQRILDAIGWTKADLREL